MNMLFAVTAFDACLIPIAVASLKILFEEASSQGWGGLERRQPIFRRFSSCDSSTSTRAAAARLQRREVAWARCWPPLHWGVGVPGWRDRDLRGVRLPSHGCGAGLTGSSRKVQ